MDVPAPPNGVAATVAPPTAVGSPRSGAIDWRQDLAVSRRNGIHAADYRAELLAGFTAISMAHSKARLAIAPILKERRGLAPTWLVRTAHACNILGLLALAFVFVLGFAHIARDLLSPAILVTLCFALGGLALFGVIAAWPTVTFLVNLWRADWNASQSLGWLDYSDAQSDANLQFLEELRWLTARELRLFRIFIMERQSEFPQRIAGIGTVTAIVFGGGASGVWALHAQITTALAHVPHGLALLALSALFNAGLVISSLAMQTPNLLRAEKRLVEHAIRERKTSCTKTQRTKRAR